MKRHILTALTAFALFLTLFPATLAAASGESVAVIEEVRFSGDSVRVCATAPDDCALFVGLYDESGKMTALYTADVIGAPDEQTVDVQTGGETDADCYAKAFLLHPDTLAPLCESVDSIFRPDEYALVERIVIETTADGVTTRTGSASGLAYTNPGFTGANAEQLQRAYNQSKNATGDSPLDAQAQLRLSNGTRRTVTLDDSRNYRTDAESDSVNAGIIAGAAGYDAEGYALDADGGRILLSGASGDGMGNWIAEPFTAGHIVRVRSGEDSYHLQAVSASRSYKAGSFSLVNNRMMNQDDAITTADGVEITADSGTRFVIEDINAGTYTAYDGVENAPDVNPYMNAYGVAQYATAYIYHSHGAAKAVFVTNARNVSYRDE